MLFSCLEHIINLATQALIKNYSSGSHFDAKHPEAHIPSLDFPSVGTRYELAIIRTIAVKVGDYGSFQ